MEIPLRKKQVIVPEILSVVERIRVETIDVLNTSSTSTSHCDIPSSSSTSTSTDRRLDEFANLLNSCIEQMESIEKATERASMLTKRLMETPVPEPPLLEPPIVEPSAKRRRRTRFSPLLGIVELAVVYKLERH